MSDEIFYLIFSKFVHLLSTVKNNYTMFISMQQIYDTVVQNRYKRVYMCRKVSSPIRDGRKRYSVLVCV